MKIKSTNNRNKKILKINCKKIITNIITLLLLTVIILITADIIRYTELYLSTWKYQLKNDIAKGDRAAIIYYNSTYISNGKTLFSDN